MLTPQERKELDKIIINNSNYIRNRCILVEFGVLTEILQLFTEPEIDETNHTEGS